MGLGTFLSGGVIKCANCGVRIKGPANSGTGLDIFIVTIQALRNHFCSDKCRREWNTARGK